jgi:hypothetical protein
MVMCDSSLAQHPQALPSPECTPSPEHKDGKMSSSSAVDVRYSGKRISRKGIKSVPAEHDDMHLKIGKGYLRLSEEGKLNWVAGLRNLTSITSPALLPWHIMCMSSLKTCHINVEVVTCASLNFAIPSSAVIPNQNGCRIEKLSAQVPIEFLYDAFLRDGVFQYLPAVIHLAPRLLYLALHLTRNEGSGTHPGDEHDESGYDTLLQDMQSDSLETLIIDTCDVEPASVRQPRADFFESISHLTSLHSFPNLRRVVAPQEAFMSVPNLLSSDANPVFVPPTVLFPHNIETVEIIDSTSALDTWAKRLLDAHDTPTGLRVSMLDQLSSIKLWCDRWYPTLVPDYRVDA